MTTTEILEAFFKAENNRDWESYRRFLHHEIVWTLFGKKEKTILGIENYMQTIQKAYENSDIRFVCQDLQVSNDGNRIVAVLINDLKIRSIDIFDFKDNLIYREYEFFLD
ncbi:MAG: nuclear transport factor 2 family protein [Capnocytophaga sp.]|nr:nuclear transport factor 2 family protein [Capnocytophaga sp.]